MTAGTVALWYAARVLCQSYSDEGYGASRSERHAETWSDTSPHTCTCSYSSGAWISRSDSNHMTYEAMNDFD